jgi:hypothetical protein
VKSKQRPPWWPTKAQKERADRASAASYEERKARSRIEMVAIADEVAGALRPFDFEREEPKHGGKFPSDWSIRFRSADRSVTFLVTTPRTVALYRHGVTAGHLEVAPGNVAAQVVEKAEKWGAPRKEVV